jgi:hypothetical protein
MNLTPQLKWLVLTTYLGVGIFTQLFHSHAGDVHTHVHAGNCVGHTHVTGNDVTETCDDQHTLCGHYQCGFQKHRVAQQSAAEQIATSDQTSNSEPGSPHECVICQYLFTMVLCDIDWVEIPEVIPQRTETSCTEVVCTFEPLYAFAPRGPPLAV